MSRYALEWAKKQPTAVAGGKQLLLVLGDAAEGPRHTLVYRDQSLASTAGLSEVQLTETLAALANAGTTSTPVPAANQIYGYALRLTVDPLIPSAFRTLHTPPPREPRASEPGLQPTAVYRLYDASGELLYVGEAAGR